MGGGGANPSTLDDKTKAIGIALAVGSGFMIGSSFVFKKKGLLNCTMDGMVAGEGYAYLKSAMWWTGMLISSLSVVATQGLGAAIVHNISTGEPQFTNWFIYFVIVFVIVTLLIEINYLNKALNLFNTAMVTPTYYVTFTSTTIVTSAILSQGFNASAVAIITVVLGFLVICAGILLLQTSKPVMPVIVQEGKVSEVLGSVYDDFEPNAADLRASPFSSIRHITRDLRHSTISSVHQYQPTGSRAESLLQRKRRASNAALSYRSRPASIMSSLSPAISDSASATGVSPGLHQTLVMGVDGRQVRLQLCEIVVTDEHNTISRYPVYKPIVTGTQMLAPPRPAGSLQPPVAASSRPVSSLFNHTFLAPRTSMMTAESQHSTIRFINRSRRPSIAYPEDHSASMHDDSLLEKIERQSMDSADELSPPGGRDARSAGGYSKNRPLSGSLFWPPVVDVSPSPRSGPLKVGGSFFLRPKQQHHGPSHLATSTLASTDDEGEAVPGSSFSVAPSSDHGEQGSDVEAMNKTFVSIEVMDQPQPILAPYVPPPPPDSQTPLSSSGLPMPAPNSTSSSTSSSSTATNTSASSPTSTTALTVNPKANYPPIASPVRKRRGVLGRLFGGLKSQTTTDTEAAVSNSQETSPKVTETAVVETKSSVGEVTVQIDPVAATGGGDTTEHYGNDEKDSLDKVEKESSSSSPALAQQDNSQTLTATATISSPSHQSYLPQQQPHVHVHTHGNAPGHTVTCRINHPQRISEGEEEEDEEDVRTKNPT
ncbi:hypothetical protein BGW42_006248 [Actinomortierella wolfii]|nr:hypothetical protein BGW42_006248 [Actinomortierella wolfii]